MDSNKIAVLVNQYGLDEAADLLGTSADLVVKSVSGELLTRFENATLENGYSALEIFEFDNGIDFSQIDSVAGQLTAIENFVANENLANDIRFLFSNEQITPDDLESLTYFVNDNYIGTNQLEKILDWMNKDEENTAKIFLDLYDAADRDAGGEDLEDSLFWAWFRDIFYND